MNTTRATLIERVRDPHDSLAWSEFYGLYSQLIHRFGLDLGLNATDATELVSECMATLPELMSSFEYQRDRCRFRSYLQQLVRNKAGAIFRKKKPRRADTEHLQNLPANGKSVQQRWEEQWAISHISYCWQRVEKQLNPLHAEAFRRYVFQEQPTRVVAEQLGISTNLVYQIKWSVTEDLKRVARQVLGEDFELDM